MRGWWNSADTRGFHPRNGHPLCGFESRPPHPILTRPAKDHIVLTDDRYEAENSAERRR